MTTQPAGDRVALIERAAGTFEAYQENPSSETAEAAAAALAALKADIASQTQPGHLAATPAEPDRRIQAAVREQFAILLERCDQADSRLGDLANQTDDNARLRAAQQGIRLVRSYIQEAERAL
jgi:hypothetical protein